MLGISLTLLDKSSIPSPRSHLPALDQLQFAEALTGLGLWNVAPPGAAASIQALPGSHFLFLPPGTGFLSSYRAAVIMQLK